MTTSDRPDDAQTPPNMVQRIEAVYIRVLSFVLRRVFAALFMVVGSLGVIMGGIYALSGNPIYVNGVPTTSIGVRLLYAVSPLIPIAFGWFLWRLKPLDPRNNFAKYVINLLDKMTR